MSPYIPICCVTYDYRWNRVTDDIINVHYLFKQLDISCSRIKTKDGILPSFLLVAELHLITNVNLN